MLKRIERQLCQPLHRSSDYVQIVRACMRLGCFDAKTDRRWSVPARPSHHPTRILKSLTSGDFHENGQLTQRRRGRCPEGDQDFFEAIYWTFWSLNSTSIAENLT